MATYVLVHGAWSGAHGFRHVRRLLQSDGHAVFTPSLTGIGERVHLTSPQVGLTTHVQDVVNQVLYEDLDDLVLLGFSYGGMVVTGALAHMGPRVRHLVYLDAFVPDDGQSLVDLTGAGAGAVAAMAIGDTWLVPPPAREFDDPAEAAFSTPRRTPHPVGCFTEPVHLPVPLEALPCSLTYIRAAADVPEGRSAFEAAAARARSSPAWRYHEVDSNHMIPNNRPEELAALLAALA